MWGRLWCVIDPSDGSTGNLLKPRKLHWQNSSLSEQIDPIG
jgi:hypothetical protein